MNDDEMKRRLVQRQGVGESPSRTCHHVTVLIWSSNRTLSALVARNLIQRGFTVRQTPMPLEAPPPPVASDADVVVVDIDAPEPELWGRSASVRAAIPGVPLVVLGHAWPSSPRLDPLQPCMYVRKPFAIHDLVAAVQAAPAQVR